MNITIYKKLFNNYRIEILMKNPNSKGFSIPSPHSSISFILSSSEYRKKCDLARTRLDALQQKTKQYRELMINLTGNSEKKYVDISSIPPHTKSHFRIADLQSALFRMKQQYETSQKRIREETDLKNKFEQDLIREQQRIRELTIQTEQQQKILKLKTEGLVAAQRKLRGLNTNFDTDMEKLITERKELEILKQDIQKREELIEKRELLFNEKLQLEKQSNVTNHQHLREELLKRKEQLEEILPSTERRRLIEIDEAIEAINLAIDYQNNIISKRERDVQQSIRTSQVQNIEFIR